VNPEQDLITWKKPPDLRDFLYTEAKLDYQKQRWNAACEKFDEILELGHGENWHHTKKYAEVCLKHLQHRRRKTDGTQVYNDAKHLYEEGQYADAEIAFNYVIEIMELGPGENFHHTREYLKKCKQMRRKEALSEEELAQEEGNIDTSDGKKILHYYTSRYPLGISQKVSLLSHSTLLQE
jgi:outer membrane protein assembly factor BamD (BamD/ComL family)